MKVYNGDLFDVIVKKSFSEIIIEQEGWNDYFDKIIIEKESVPDLIKALKKLIKSKKGLK